VNGESQVKKWRARFLAHELHTKVGGISRLRGNQHRCLDVSRSWNSSRNKPDGQYRAWPGLQFAPGLGEIVAQQGMENGLVPVTSYLVAGQCAPFIGFSLTRESLGIHPTPRGPGPGLSCSAVALAPVAEVFAVLALTRDPLFPAAAAPS